MVSLSCRPLTRKYWTHQILLCVKEEDCLDMTDITPLEEDPEMPRNNSPYLDVLSFSDSTSFSAASYPPKRQGPRPNDHDEEMSDSPGLPMGEECAVKVNEKDIAQDSPNTFTLPIRTRSFQAQGSGCNSRVTWHKYATKPHARETRASKTAALHAILRGRVKRPLGTVEEEADPDLDPVNQRYKASKLRRSARLASKRRVNQRADSDVEDSMSAADADLDEAPSWV